MRTATGRVPLEEERNMDKIKGDSATITGDLLFLWRVDNCFNQTFKVMGKPPLM